MTGMLAVVYSLEISISSSVYTFRSW